MEFFKDLCHISISGDSFIEKMSGRLLNYVNTNNTIRIIRSEFGTSIQKNEAGKIVLNTTTLVDIFREKLNQHKDITCVLTFHGGKYNFF